MTYAVGIGWDVALEELAAVAFCRNGEVRPIERRYGDGGPVEARWYSAPVFEVFATPAEYQAELAKFGLDAAETARVTWYTRDEVFEWARYNGIAVRPEPGVDGALRRVFLRGFVIYIHSLERLA